MIYIRRNANLIPSKILKAAERAETRLAGMGEAERREFIKKKSHIWRAFGRHLSKMSYGKCWYSESPDPQSFFDVDHFRPKLEARRSDTDVDSPGYEWLAFSWENFRYAANCSNRASTNHETGAVDGKGSWFPLVDGSPKAGWANRCCGDEKPVLLDPVERSDVKLIDVAADGRIVASRYAIGSAEHRVIRSCELYGLNLPGIKAARLRLMREINELLEVVTGMLVAAAAPSTPATTADLLPLNAQLEIISAKTRPESPYSKAARAVLIREGWGDLCVAPEDAPHIIQRAANEVII